MKTKQQIKFRLEGKQEIEHARALKSWLLGGDALEAEQKGGFRLLLALMRANAQIAKLVKASGTIFINGRVFFRESPKAKLPAFGMIVLNSGVLYIDC